MRTIASLDEAAQQMAGGRMNPVVEFDNKDELGQVTFAFNKIASALIKARTELEQKVEERTVELSRTNEQLKVEIVERKHAEAALNGYAGLSIMKLMKSY
jgi:nitrate/nitrite-specific signal transduction histidine kinase